MNGLRIPVATYRLQFQPGFGFRDARELTPYLDRLGVTDVYASPLFRASGGSVHGYDVTDHSQLNPELGGEDEFQGWSEALRERSMGLIIDVVPNHMKIGDPANRWWQDVLENGPSSVFASFFDIDWRPPAPVMRNRVLLPVLGDQFGKVLEDGEIRLMYEAGAFYVGYFERRFPLDPRTSVAALDEVAEHLRATGSSDAPELIELESIVTALGHLPERSATEPAKLTERRREKEVAKRRLLKLAEESAGVRRAIEGVVTQWNGQQGEPESFDRLEALLSGQAYRLCHWKVAADEINYRRFFDIDDLAAIRVEMPEVFEAVHGLLLRLVGEGRVSGLRIDHPDGLYDPQQYLADLQSACRGRIPQNGAEGGKPSAGASASAIYVVVEKILSGHEQLPASWAAHGTTGYEVLNLINGLFVDSEAQQPFYGFYREVCDGVVDFDDLLYHCKQLILEVSMSSELHVLARRLDRVSDQHRYSRDFTMWGLQDALREIIACFPAYRTYVRPDTTSVSDEERRQIETAVRAARRRNPTTEASVFDFVESLLLLEAPEHLSPEQRAERREFVMKLQQLTGPVTAKGLEDTAFYRAYPLASLNEVGGEPGRFGVSLEEFHRHNKVRCGRWPYGMTASSTHDSKRSEDVRAWLNVLSEIPQQWFDAVRRWQELNCSKKRRIDDGDAPDSNEEYLLYQTLVGTWPLEEISAADHAAFVERIVAYMSKALKEAKLHTSWINPDSEYDQAVSGFVRDVLDREADNPFLEELQQFRRRIDPAGMCNALAQLLLKVTVPGVPDFYQGCELWNFTLVDPDNRRPVDYELRGRLLDELLRRAEENRADLIDDLLPNWRDGRIKLFMTAMSLAFRRERAELFLQGEYLPLEATGDRAAQVCPFLRRRGDEAALTVVPRLVAGLTTEGRPPLGPAAWGDTGVVLPKESPAKWRNIFTADFHQIDDSRRLPLADVLGKLPVALLTVDR